MNSRIRRHFGALMGVLLLQLFVLPGGRACAGHCCGVGAMGDATSADTHHTMQPEHPRQSGDQQPIPTAPTRCDMTAACAGSAVLAPDVIMGASGVEPPELVASVTSRAHSGPPVSPDTPPPRA